MADRATQEIPILFPSATYKQSHEEGSSRIRSYPAILHFGVLSLCVLPIAFLPYLATRRQMGAIRRQIGVLDKDMRRLRNELEMALSSTSSELRRLQLMAVNTSKESKGVRTQANRIEEERNAFDKVVRADLRTLYEQMGSESRIQAATLQELGMSLAEIASFMQEVDVEFGLKSGGEREERLRSLALRLQKQ